jgi:hypothetical protein
MKQVKRTVILFLLSLSFFSLAEGQEAITASGGAATGSGGSVSYAVGQIAYSIYTGSNGTVSQGVIQPFEISVVTAIDDVSIVPGSKVYPNPAQGAVKLVFESDVAKNTSFRLYDINGVLLKNEKVEAPETEISMENFSPSVYFLKIYTDNLEVKVFKIIKK